MHFYIQATSTAETSADTTKARNIDIVAALCHHTVLLDSFPYLLVRYDLGLKRERLRPQRPASQLLAPHVSVTLTGRYGFLQSLYSQSRITGDRDRFLNHPIQFEVHLSTSLRS